MSPIKHEHQSFNVGVKALIQDDSGAILILRKATTGKWEVPGGRINQGASLADTLGRELDEELPGATLITLGKVMHVAEGSFPLDDQHNLLLVFFVASVALPEHIIISKEHLSIARVNTETIDSYELYATDEVAIRECLATTGSATATGADITTT